jgi:molybdopterin-guanine dinucleotide biosynthesis protein A
MGRDKAALVIKGEPLWSRQVSILRQFKPETILISGRQAPAWVPQDIQVVLDRPPSRGPLSGIAAALELLSTSHLLALAVDMPKMTSEHLEKLASFAAFSCGIIPRNDDYFEPLAAIYPKEAAPIALRALESSDFSLQSFARELLQRRLIKSYSLSSEERNFYRNLNTMEELE